RNPHLIASLESQQAPQIRPIDVTPADIPPPTGLPTRGGRGRRSRRRQTVQRCRRECEPSIPCLYVSLCLQSGQISLLVTPERRSSAFTAVRMWEAPSGSPTLG